MSRVKGEQPETKVKSAFDNQELGSGFSDTDGNELDLSNLDYPDCMKVIVGASDDTASNDTIEFDLKEKSAGGSYSATGDTVSISDSDTPGVTVTTLDIEGNKQFLRFTADASDSTLTNATDVHIDVVFSGMDSIPQ